jgi:DNA polymerase-4
VHPVRHRAHAAPPGIGPKTAERLAELGYATVAQSQEADEAQLAARFGDRTACYLKARASSTTTRRSRRSPAPRSRSRPRDLRQDIADHDELERSCTLARLCEACKSDRGRTVAIKVRLGPGRRSPAPHAPGRRTTRPRHETALEPCGLRAPQPVRLLGVRLAASTTSSRQAAGPPRRSASWFDF